MSTVTAKYLLIYATATIIMPLSLRFHALNWSWRCCPFNDFTLQGFLTLIIIIIIIIKICNAQISTLLGAQGAETKKKHEYKQFTVIAKKKLCTEIHVQCNYKYTSSLKNCDIRWFLSSDLNPVILWQDLSLDLRIHS